MKQKGISLIALIITIIVIIILAVITIFGVNGVIEKAREAKVLQEISNEKEIISAATVQAKKGINSFNEETLGKAMDNITGIGETYVFADSDNLAVQFKKSERYYLVDKDGAIEGPVYPIEDEYAGDVSKGGKYDGSEEKPYQINCIEDLVAFSIMSHGGNTELELKNDSFSNKYVELARSLDFQSIFSYHDYTTEKYGDLNQDTITENLQTELTKKEEKCIGFRPISFYGTFDGKENTIKNLYMKAEGGNLAFFTGRVKEIKNLNITGEIINTGWVASGIYAGDGTYVISNCKNYANITGHSFVAGIVPFPNDDESIINNCENYGTITITGIAWSYGGAGGIAGDARGVIIDNCRNYGNIVKADNYTSSTDKIGGIVGEVDAVSDSYKTMTTIKNCINYADNEYGGIAGVVLTSLSDKNVDIINCCNMGKCAGGIVFDVASNTLELNIINCYNFGECKSGIINNFYASKFSNIKNCYNLGKTNYGLIGQYSSNSPIYIENCYNGGESQKAIIGSKSSATSQTNIVNTYYNSSKSSDVGAIADGVMGLTDEEMRNQKTVADTGKTLVEILNENIGTNEDWKHWTVGANGYPVFVSE